MASQNMVSLGNLALLSIGARASVSSISPSDGSTAADAISTLYIFCFEMLARTARWACLKKQVGLTLIQAAQGTPENPDGTSLPLPQQPWLYAYLYPSDCLFVREILCPNIPNSIGGIPQTTINNSVTPWVGDSYQIPYEIGYTTDSSGNPLQIILTDQEQALGNYTVNQPNPTSWDSLLTSAYVATLAVYLAPALSLNTPLMAACKQQAESLIAIARAQDANESPVSQDHVPDFIKARQGSSGYLFYAPKLNAYSNIQWPG